MSTARPVGRAPDPSREFPSAALREDPYAFYADLRRDDPVHRLPDGSWLVSRHEDVVRVAGDPETFSSATGALSRQTIGGPRVGGDDSGPWSLPFTDAKQHRKQRSFASSLVRRHRLDWFAPIIAGIADDLIDAFPGSGEVEFKAAFAEPLPRRVMMKTFGFPSADEADIVRWTSGPGIGSKLKRVGAERPSPEQEAAELRTRTELIEYVRHHVVARHREPADDFLSELTQAQVARDGGLDERYIVAESIGLFSGGFLTTVHMMASTMLLLGGHPEHLARVRADRTLLPAVIEEGLRLESPVQFLQRLTTRDTELRGVHIPAGSTVILVWGSANRDERRYDRPEAFDPGRADVSRHVGFGTGVHKCIGAPLARLEGRLAFGRLLDRLSGLRLAEGRNDDVTHVLDSVNMRAPSAVHIAFDRRSETAGGDDDRAR